MIAASHTLAMVGSGAVGSIALARHPRASLFVSLAGIVVAGLACCGNALQVLVGMPTPIAPDIEWPLPIGSATFVLDGLSAWFLLTIGALSTGVGVYSWGYFRSGLGHGSVWAATALLNILGAAMVITVCAGDLVVFMFGWELMSLSAFLLVGFDHRNSKARHGAWMYLVATHLGTAVGVLPVFGAFAATARSTSFAGFAGSFDSSESAVCVALFFLGLVGFGTKAGIMPMHVWLPEAHPVAPSPVSVLMSGAVIMMGIYALLRLISWLPPLSRGCGYAVVAIAIVTGVTAILYAMAQRQYKPMLAYSSVENIGIITLGIGLGMLGRATHQPIVAVLGFSGALLHVLNHALFKGLLFLSAGAVLHATGVDNIERLGGVARRDPLNAALFLFGCVAICGLPPLNGFVSEFLIYSGLLRGAGLGLPLVTAFALVGAAALALIGGLALAGFSKLFGVMFLGEARDAQIRIHATPMSMVIGMSILALGCVAIAIGAPFFGSLLDAPLRTVAVECLEGRGALDSIFSPLAWVGVLCLVAVGVAGALIAFRRRRSLAEFASDRQVTWGCGYAAPTARMQYTGSSYVWKLMHSFRNVLRPQRSVLRPAGCFAEESSLDTRTLDIAVQKGYQPVFRAVARGCERLWPLQHGRIQLYLTYLIATLLVVFAVEAWFSPFSVDEPSIVTPAVSMGRSLEGAISHGGDRLP